MLIRPETPADIPAIEQVHIAAFANHPYSHQTEHLIVNALRASGALAVSLVAEEAGEVLGHIAFSPAAIDGQPSNWLLVGPLGVLPGRQRQGLGRALVRAGLDAIRAQGASGCALVGDPGYYLRLGFRQCEELSYAGVPPENFMCLALDAEVPRGPLGHHPAFDI